MYDIIQIFKNTVSADADLRHSYRLSWSVTAFRGGVFENRLDEKIEGWTSTLPVVPPPLALMALEGCD